MTRRQGPLPPAPAAVLARRLCLRCRWTAPRTTTTTRSFPPPIATPTIVRGARRPRGLALALRVLPLTAAPIPAVRRVSGFPHGYRNMASTRGRVKGYKSRKPDKFSPVSCTKDHYAIGQGMKGVETRSTTLEVRESSTKERKRAVVLSDDEDVTILGIFPESTHRDGSIYNMGTHIWKRNYHVADRNETRLEAMMLSNPTDCVIRNGKCTEHTPRLMLQFFQIKLAKLFVDSGPVKLYGYIAVRDGLDPLLNYVVTLSRDDPIIVEQVYIHTYLQLFHGISLPNAH